MATKETIRVTTSSIDGFRKSRGFKTLAGAQKFAARYVGDTPEISEAFNYAVSSYGTTKVESSIKVAKLFPKLDDGHCGYGPDTGPPEQEAETPGSGYEGPDELTGYEEHLAHEIGASFGDARRCPRHPGIKVSSDDGLFDSDCPACEGESDEAYEVEKAKEKAYYISPALLGGGNAPSELEVTDDDDGICF